MTTASSTFVISGRVSPHEEFMLGYGTLVGALYLFGAFPYPVALSHAPLIFKLVWATTLTLSGLMGIVGRRLSGERALGLELAGLMMAAGPLLMISALGFIATGYSWRGLLGAAVLALFAGAHLTRAWQIRKELRAVAKGTKR
jgi:hypothetical protein